MNELNEILKFGFEDFRNFVNPLVAKRVDLSGEPSHVTSTKDSKLVLEDGTPIEDFHGTQAFGHRHPKITKALQAFLSSDSPNWFPSRVNPYSGRLARKLCERSEFYTNAFFASSGSEAVESGIKLARAVTGRPKILGMERAYHGCTMGSCSLMGESPYKNLFSPHLSDVHSIPINEVAILEEYLSQENVAAVIAEPIQVEGGVRPLSASYIEALCRLTKKYGTLLIADEVQTGMGRTGKFLASQDWPRRPDAVLLGKHLGGGLAPISAMLTHRELFEKAYGRDFETSEAHNCTFSGSALVSVGALAALDVLDDEMIANVGFLGKKMRMFLHENLCDLPLYQETTGEGLTVGIITKPLSHPWLSFEHFGMDDLKGRPSTGLLLCHRLYKRGYFCFVCGHDWRVLRVQPRFTITESELLQFAKAVREELSYLCEMND